VRLPDIGHSGGNELVLESIEHRAATARGREWTVCLGIPGEVVEMVDVERKLAKVDVVGVRRNVHVGLLEEEWVCPGDWVLIHVGFAMAKIDENEARRALQSLQMMGAAYSDEVQAVMGSQIT